MRANPPLSDTPQIAEGHSALRNGVLRADVGCCREGRNPRAAHPLRRAAESISSDIRRDRGDALYIVHGSAPQHPYFQQESRGAWTVLSPSKSGMQALDESLDAPLPFGFARFSGRAVAPEDMLLLCRGIKLLETDCPAAEVQKYDRDIRRRAALLLRTHDNNAGGALPLCMRIVEKIERERKEKEK